MIASALPETPARLRHHYKRRADHRDPLPFQARASGSMSSGVALPAIAPPPRANPMSMKRVDPHRNVPQRVMRGQRWQMAQVITPSRGSPAGAARQAMTISQRMLCLICVFSRPVRKR